MEKSYRNPPCTPLQAAVMGRYTDSVGIASFLLDFGVDIEGCCKEKLRTPLELAIDSRNYEMIKLLVDRGANTEKGYGNPPCTPLQAAVMGRYTYSVDIASFLLDFGVNIDGCCKEEPKTPLQLAINNGKWGVIKFLLTREADAEMAYGDPPCTPLQAVALGRYKDSVRLASLLLDSGVNIEGCCKEEPQTPLELAMNNGNFEILKLLIDRGANILKAGYDKPFYKPLQIAAMGRFEHSLNFAQFLLDQGANIERSYINELEPRAPLELAIEGGDHKMIALLLARGANPESASYGKPSCTPLQRAAMGLFDDSIGLAKCLLENGAKVEGNCRKERRMPLELAMEGSNFEMIEVLIKAGADPSHGYRYTPLQRVAMGNLSNSTLVANLLLAGKPNVEGCSEQEPRTPLQIAIDNRDHEMVQILLGLGADIGKHYADSAHAPIGKVIGYGDLDMFKSLLGHVEMEYCSPGRTLLQIVVEMQPSNSVDMAGCLLASGAKIDGYTDEEPRTPLQIAVGIDDRKMAQFLIAHGANIEGCSAGALKKPLQMAAEKHSKEMV
ncbi:ankyrin [Morchella conica CCBAS932]|uniref:Ankyrin n=1 Tax=Morchella conica CCBAS932 TaxID=1392247 RepID=A0A3N4KD86_9PEZI|nr:ankyrin [Morchella conica CCBAS932]